MDEPMQIVVIDGGEVEYNAREAAVPIADLISTLEAAQEDGATHVVASSGNHRGAKWSKIGLDYDWVD